jgi:hypothetical protein
MGRGLDAGPPPHGQLSGDLQRGIHLAAATEVVDQQIHRHPSAHGHPGGHRGVEASGEQRQDAATDSHGEPARPGPAVEEHERLTVGHLDGHHDGVG